MTTATWRGVSAMATIEDGIHPGLTYAEYDAIPAVRRSLLMKGPTMAHLRAAELAGEDDASAALLLGQALHSAVLEPDDFEARVILGPINPKTGEPYGRKTKACEDFAAENPGKIILGKGDREAVAGMGHAIRTHPTASKLVRAVTRSELTLVWTDQITGLRCKARIDGFAGGGLGMLDLKSTTDAIPDAMARSMYEYGYDVQAAMSIDGWKYLTGEAQPFTLIAVENAPPYAVAVYSIGPDSIAVGRTRYIEKLRDLEAARRTGVYPGYPTDVLPLDLPEWVFKRFHAGE